MADSLPLAFPLPSESAIASYDWIDFAEGTGIINFYGFTTKLEITDYYKLIRNTGYTAKKNTVATFGADTALTKVIDVDFDLSQFNHPQTLQGTMIVEMCGATGNSTITSSNITYMVVRLRKWDGASETEIADAQSTTTTVSTATTTGWNEIMHLTIPQTHFKIGEILRVTVEGWATCGAGAGSRSLTLYHEPLATSTPVSPADHSDLIFKIPFKIER